MTEWEPATEAEVAMRDALRIADQELYFRIVARTELLLPVSADALAGRAPMGWGTWNSGGRTHVLAFTSTDAMRVCLAEHAGSARKVPYHELAAGWPNQEWWLAVNPGLPIEGYLPPWFVNQLARGDVRMPGRVGRVRVESRPEETITRGPAGFARSSTARSFGDPRSTDVGAQTVRVDTSHMRQDTAPGSTFNGFTPPGRTAPRGDVPPRERLRRTDPSTFGTRGGSSSAVSHDDASSDTGPDDAFPADDGSVDDRTETFHAGSAGGGADAFGNEPADGRTETFRAGGPAGAFRSGSSGDRADLFGNESETYRADSADDRAEAFRAGSSGDREDLFGNESDTYRARSADDRADAYGNGSDTSRPGSADDRADAYGNGSDTYRAGSAGDRAETYRAGSSGDREDLFGNGSDPYRAGSGGDRADTYRTGSAGDRADTYRAGSRGRTADSVDDRTETFAAGSGARGRADSFDGFGNSSARADASGFGGRTGSTSFGGRARPPRVDRPDEPIDAEMVDIEIDASEPMAARAADAPGEAPRRARREEVIIDAEIIESTVLDASSLGARFVNATVIDASGIQEADVIDVAVLDTSTEQAPRGERVEAAESRARAQASGRTTHAVHASASFTPANEVERDLLAAAASSQIDKFLSTLLLARVLIPIPTGESPDIKPDNPAFPWRRETIDGKDMLVVFTSPERLTEYMGDSVVAVNARFMQLIHAWPDVNWPFAVNPGTPVGATLPGIQIKALAAWADDVGLTDDDPEIRVEPVPPPPPPMTIIMQKPIAPSQVDYYLDRGYDRASGFVHRAAEIAHLDTPAKIFSTLGLAYSGTPFEVDADDIFVLRWAAHRPDLYRIPYGGQHEAAMRAMQGWMIERSPFRGNGFAPADNGEVIAEFKVDSVRLPHGAQMWRLTSAGAKTLIAMLDGDECLWRPVRGVSGDDAWDPTTPLWVTAPALNAAPAPAPPQPADRVPADPTEDPLDPRWSGRATSRVGER